MILSYEAVFTLINLSVLPAWGLLVFLPGSAWTRRVVHSGLYPALLGSFYIACFAAQFIFGAPSAGGNFNSAAGISALFSQPLGVLIGWSHYLVFDLFVGAWTARDAKRRGMAHLALVPCLFFTLLLGPVGLLLYLIVRAASRKGGLWLAETGA